MSSLSDIASDRHLAPCPGDEATRPPSPLVDPGVSPVGGRRKKGVPSPPSPVSIPSIPSLRRVCRSALDGRSTDPLVRGGDPISIASAARGRPPASPQPPSTPSISLARVDPPGER
eukprot:1187828-Prorocentrum_minimum.AAC.4